MGGSFAEIIARVMIVGARSAIHWLTSGFFNLDNWAQTGDLMGWRTVEVVNVAVNGLAVWVDSLEWLFLLDDSVSYFPLCGIEARQSLEYAVGDFGSRHWGTFFHGLLVQCSSFQILADLFDLSICGDVHHSSSPYANLASLVESHLIRRARSWKRSLVCHKTSITNGTRNRNDLKKDQARKK